MKILYVECKMGAAGDMLMSALLELHKNAEDFAERFNALGIPHVELKIEKSEKCGICGTHAKVLTFGKEEGEHSHGHSEHHHDHHHYHGHVHHEHGGLAEIRSLIEGLPLKRSVCENAVNVYKIIAEAEAKVHGRDIEHIHFHEVGTMDAVADIVGVCMLIDEIGADKIAASPVNMGGGFVKCAHGTLPVPAPATAEILRGIPSYSDSDEGEFCTPTGAALLKYFVSDFCGMPVMRVEKTGIGLGTKDFSRANMLRVFMGEAEEKTEGMYELSCNIDDMTGEELAFAAERIFEAGARDVFTVPITMKKGRPAILLNCICSEGEKTEVVKAVFKHTTTIGVREFACERHVMERKEEMAETKYGSVRIKHSFGFGTEKQKAEYEDIAALAKENSVSLFDIKKEI